MSTPTRTAVLHLMLSYAANALELAGEVLRHWMDFPKDFAWYSPCGSSPSNVVRKGILIESNKSPRRDLGVLFGLIQCVTWLSSGRCLHLWSTIRNPYPAVVEICYILKNIKGLLMKQHTESNKNGSEHPLNYRIPLTFNTSRYCLTDAGLALLLK